MTANALEAMITSVPGPDRVAADAVLTRAGSVLRPSGALARLDRVAAWLAGWQRTDRPRVDHPWVVVFAGDHGVAAAGVSAYPADVTKAMLGAFDAGVATAPAMARALGATFTAVDVGVGAPTGDIRSEPALDPARFEACVAAGRNATRCAADDGAELLVFGEMGIGNTTAASAVCTSIFGGPAADWVGRGTGVDDRGLARKVAAVEAARTRAAGLGWAEILRTAGGAELVAISAAIAEARLRSIPVLLDGFVVGASAAPLHMGRPDALDHCIAGHVSAEIGHGLLLERLGLEPLVDLGLRLGEASGALVALTIVRLAAVAVCDVATFDEWGMA